VIEAVIIGGQKAGFVGDASFGECPAPEVSVRRRDETVAGSERVTRRLWQDEAMTRNRQATTGKQNRFFLGVPGASWQLNSRIRSLYPSRA
jgi:hypothetical protein